MKTFCVEGSSAARGDSVRRDDRGDLVQHSSTQRFSLGRQPSTLVIVEPQASPARFQLFFENAVLFDQAGNQLRLLTGHPAGERSQEEFKMYGFRHPASFSAGGQAVG